MPKVSWDADEIVIRLWGLKLTLANCEGVHCIMGEALPRDTQRCFRSEVGAGAGSGCRSPW